MCEWMREWLCVSAGWSYRCSYSVWVCVSSLVWEPVSSGLVFVKCVSKTCLKDLEHLVRIFFLSERLICVWTQTSDLIRFFYFFFLPSTCKSSNTWTRTVRHTHTNGQIIKWTWHFETKKKILNKLLLWAR